MEDIIWAAAPLRIEGKAYNSNRVARCVVCNGVMRRGDLGIRLAVGDNRRGGGTTRAMWIHGEGCGMGAVVRMMKTWTKLNNGNGHKKRRVVL